MIRQRLSVQFSIWITLLIILVSTVLALILVKESGNALTALNQASVERLQHFIYKKSDVRIESIVSTLAGNLVNPLYQQDMLEMRQLLESTLALADIKTTKIFLPDGKVLNDGLRLLPAYGQPVSEKVKRIFEMEPESSLIFRQDDILTAVKVIMIGDEALGALLIELDLSPVSLEARLMQTSLNKLSAETFLKNKNTALLTTILMITMGILLAVYASVKVTRPIAKIAKKIKRIGQGGYAEIIDRPGNIELSQLVDVVNFMSKEISTSTVSMEYLGHIINSMHESLIVLDANLEIVMTNTKATEVTCLKGSQLKSMMFINLFIGSDKELVLNWLDNIANRRENSILEAHILSQQGDEIPISLSGSMLQDNQVQEGAIVCVFQDISERKQQQEKMQFLAQYDGLTELPNRSLFNDRLMHAMQQSEYSEHLITLLYLDLDGFKKINDSLGHAVGDELLKEVANRLTNCVKTGDTVARLGGDEFSIIVENMIYTEEAEKLAELIIETLGEPYYYGEDELHIGVSIGIVFYPFSDFTADDLLKKADIAMYRSKSTGRSSYSYYQVGVREFARDEFLLENDLRNALLSDQFEIFYQPLIEFSSDKIIATEALIRWNHPERGYIPPDKFISMLEEIGLMDEVDKWVLDRSCAQAKQWSEYCKIRMSVNLSTHQFENANLLKIVKSTLQKHQLEASQLELEITEGSLVTDVGGCKRLLDNLSSLGVTVAVDDFGTGYSSLSYLSNLKLNALKIDRSFIAKLPTDKTAESICAAIVAMAKALNLRVVAEGIETREQYDLLKHLGADECQGHYTAKPVKPDEILKLLDEKS